MMTVNKHIILLVEDNSSDVQLTKACIENRDDIQLEVAKDGQKALNFLRKEGRYSNAPRPDLIFLDLNMPRMNGIEFLKELRTNKKLFTIPVIVLTTSNSDRDVMAAYESGANSYVTKAVDFDDFQKKMDVIIEFWFEIACLPPAEL